MDTAHSTLIISAWLFGSATLSLPSIGFMYSIGQCNKRHVLHDNSGRLDSPTSSNTTIESVRQEVFFLNFEDGYFGCQVNESADVLQLFKISKICDGHPDCFMGSDENHLDLKCTNDCSELTGVDCKNGVCMDSQCHCNDGYGGKGCELPDENECKLRPCDIFGHCTNTIGSFFCTCFPGYEGDGFYCKDIDECKIPSLSERCKPNAECYNLPAHYICKCNTGYEGDGEYGCEDINECLQSNACGINGICNNSPGYYSCICPIGFNGDPYSKCLDIDECTNSTICHHLGAECTNLPGTYSCKCRSGFYEKQETDDCFDINECSVQDTCPQNSLCINTEGSFSCKCNPGFEHNANQTCVDINECKDAGACGKNGVCLNQEGTFSCLCALGHSSPGGVVECKGQPCDIIDGQSLRDSNCTCPGNSFFDKFGFCTPCDEANGFRSNIDGQCVCNSSDNTISGKLSNCFCRKENVHVNFGEQCDERKSCTFNSNCPDHTTCSLKTGTCQNPCETKICGTNAYCQPADHKANCLCPQWLSGNGEIACSIRPGRTDFPRPELTVNCLADFIQVDIAMSNFLDMLPNSFTPSELFYVKGHSKDPDCRKLVESFVEPVDFRVKFGTCGLSHTDGEAGFILVVQKHPRLVTYTAQAYNIKCLYFVGEKTVKTGLNISALTTAGTISNTGPPPTCVMRVVSATGEKVNSVEIGASLLLKVDVQPSTIYTGFARNCVAKTTEGDDEIEYIVTDDSGCATDPAIFGNWEIIPETQVLSAHFNAFKFPTSGGIKFQCDVRVCFGSCLAVNCHNQSAFGRRKREISRSVSNASSSIGSSIYPGRLKEEITLQSNVILTIDNREDRVYNPIKAPKILKKEICMSTTGFLVTIISTALLTLVTAAITISYWMMMLRRRVISGNSLHTIRFPSSYYTTRKLLLQSTPD